MGSTLMQIASEFVALARQQLAQIEEPIDYRQLVRVHSTAAGFNFSGDGPTAPDPSRWAMQVDETTSDLRALAHELFRAIPASADKTHARGRSAFVASAVYGAVSQDCLGEQPAVETVARALVDFILKQNLTEQVVVGVKGIEVAAPVQVEGYELKVPTDLQRSWLLGDYYMPGMTFSPAEATVIASRNTTAHWTAFHRGDRYSEVARLRRLLRAAVHEDLEFTGPNTRPLGISSSFFAGASISAGGRGMARVGRWRGGVPVRLDPPKAALVAEVAPTLHLGKHGLGVAADRLERASSRENHVDRLVDSVIALEALISDGRAALGYKLAMRIPRLISPVSEHGRRLSG